MSFGFPAYSTDSQRFNLTPGDLVEVIREALQSLGWRYEMPSQNEFVARNSLNLWSWGEKISIEVSFDGVVKARSECALPTQCFDWGKNSRNVKIFFGEVARLASGREARALPVPSYDDQSRTPLERVIKEGGEVER